MSQASPESGEVEPLRQSKWGAFLLFDLIRLVYLCLSVAIVATIYCKIGLRHTFNGNEGWNAFWAMVASNGSQLYPDPSSLKLNSYLPFWFYTIGALGRVIGDNIQAGRLLAGLALLLNAFVITLIVREITGRKQGNWFAAAAFLSICGLFYPNYVAACDPHFAAVFVMSVALLLFVRNIDQGLRGACLVIPLLLLGGLVKHSAVSVPITVALFLLLYRRPIFVGFAARAGIGVIAVSGALYVVFGPGLFSSVFFPRQYDFGIAWAQARDQIAAYNSFLLVIPFLAFDPRPKVRLILLYAVVALTQGFALSGIFDIDVNAFFDFAVAISIGLGLLQNFVGGLILDRSATWKANVSLAGFLVIALTPVVVAAPSGVAGAIRIFDAVTASTQQEDVDFLRAAQGRVACENLALCYWAGKDFEVDLVNLKILLLARPDVEVKFVEQINSCSFSLIQLANDWDDDEDGPFTEEIIDALNQHYEETEKTDSSHLLEPAHCDKKS